LCLSPRVHSIPSFHPRTSFDGRRERDGPRAPPAVVGLICVEVDV
jgi:hypothetical protein